MPTSGNEFTESNAEPVIGLSVPFSLLANQRPDCVRVIKPSRVQQGTRLMQWRMYAPSPFYISFDTSPCICNR
jgi:hypothetical protein